jgi:hypothetical protein
LLNAERHAVHCSDWVAGGVEEESGAVRDADCVLMAVADLLLHVLRPLRHRVSRLLLLKEFVIVAECPARARRLERPADTLNDPEHDCVEDDVDEGSEEFGDDILEETSV